MKLKLTGRAALLNEEPGQQALRVLKRQLTQWGVLCETPAPFRRPAELLPLRTANSLIFCLCPSDRELFQQEARSIAQAMGLEAGFRSDSLFGWAKDERGTLFFLPAEPNLLSTLLEERTKTEIEQISGVSLAHRRQRLFGRLLSGQRRRGDFFRLGIFLLSMGIFSGSVWYLHLLRQESRKNLELQEETKEILEEAEEEEAELEEQERLSLREELTQQGYPREYLTKFFSLYQQNQDLAGWLTIPDTIVDYAVVQAEDNSYYMRRDFTRAENSHGVPFVDFRVNLEKPSTNLVIYGHNMNDGQMFGELIRYKSLDYYRQHPVIRFDSVYREGQYKIFGVVLCKKDDPEFNYHNFIDKPSDDDFQTYLNQIAARTLIQTPVDVQVTDTILTLSTCDYTFKSASGERIARLVIFARQVRDGEDPTVAVEQSAKADNPLLPSEAVTPASATLQAATETTAAEVQYLTAEERQSLSPRRQQALISARRAMDTGALPRPDSPEARWLSPEEWALSEDERESLIASRHRLAEQAGIDPDAYHSWTELFAAISAPRR